MYVRKFGIILIHCKSNKCILWKAKNTWFLFSVYNFNKFNCVFRKSLLTLCFLICNIVFQTFIYSFNIRLRAKNSVILIVCREGFEITELKIIVYTVDPYFNDVNRFWNRQSWLINVYKPLDKIKCRPIIRQFCIKVCVAYTLIETEIIGFNWCLIINEFT